jgi:hypothetical protein
MSEQSLVIETELTREQFIQLSVLRHFQRNGFYFTALTSGAVAAYGWFNQSVLIFFVAWTPLLIYVTYGLVIAWRDSRLREAPFLRTRYEFSDQGVHVSTSQGAGQLGWRDFAGWRVMADCYVLILSAGSILAIPQRSVPPHKRERLEQMLQTRVRK